MRQRYMHLTRCSKLQAVGLSTSDQCAAAALQLHSGGPVATPLAAGVGIVNVWIPSRSSSLFLEWTPMQN